MATTKITIGPAHSRTMPIVLSIRDARRRSSPRMPLANAIRAEVGSP